jgi:hypothetical protein
MSAKPPETFGLDRLATPIGVALLVTDAEGALRALDWEDYERRLRQLLRLQYWRVGSGGCVRSGWYQGGADRIFHRRP